MRAKLVFEKFSAESDPVHDMGIGDPLHIAGSYLQKFADKNGYHFEMKKISGVESPIIIVDLPKPYFIFWDGHQKPGASYIHRLKYTITYMPHQKPRVFSLRKVWMGYNYKPGDEAYLGKAGKLVDQGDYEGWRKWQLDELKKKMKKGGLKEHALNQQLMGRFTKQKIYIIIDKIEKSIKKEIKKAK